MAALAPTDLDAALERLMASGLISRRGTPPDATYTFKHALVQDAAYESLLKSQRITLHGNIARALEKRWPESRDTKPELLANHYTAAGLFEVAIPYWRRAGELAMQRFALREAITHLNNGMLLIEKLPHGAQRDLLELELRTVLGPAVVAQHGWAQGEVSRILEPAWSLTESLDHRPSYVPVLHSLWVHYLSVDRLALSLKSAEKLLAAGAAAGDDSLEAVGYRAASASHYWLGDLTAARRRGRCSSGDVRPSAPLAYRAAHQHRPADRRGDIPRTVSLDAGLPGPGARGERRKRRARAAPQSPVRPGLP